MTVHCQIEPDTAKAAQIEAQALHIYDPVATLKHYSRMGTAFYKAAQEAFESVGWHSTMEGEWDATARQEIGNALSEAAFDLADGRDLRDTLTRVMKNNPGVINAKGLALAAPELATGAPALAAPELVLSHSVAAEKHMECATYKTMRKVLEICSASLMENPGGGDYFRTRNNVLREIYNKLDRDVQWLTHYDPELRPLVRGKDFKPV